jgi:hypothetical protein
MTRSQTLANATHGAPATMSSTDVEGVLPSESDLASSKSKLIAELVTERKRVYTLNMDLLKKVNDNAVSVSKYESTITARDRTIANKEVDIAEQRAVVESFKSKLAAKEATHKSKILQIGSEQNAALSVLRNQLDLEKRENKGDRATALNVGRELATTNDSMKKLKCTAQKLRSDYEEVQNQYRDSKSENAAVKRQLITLTKKVDENILITHAHKERMKLMEIEREKIRYDKAKDNNYTKLLAEERKHLNIQERVENRYEKADSANEKKHVRKTTTDRENVSTAVARAAQAAMNVSMASNNGEFPNPRGVDLQRVSEIGLFDTGTSLLASITLFF